MVEVQESAKRGVQSMNWVSIAGDGRLGIGRGPAMGGAWEGWQLAAPLHGPPLRCTSSFEGELSKGETYQTEPKDGWIPKSDTRQNFFHAGRIQGDQAKNADSAFYTFTQFILDCAAPSLLGTLASALGFQCRGPFPPPVCSRHQAYACFCLHLIVSGIFLIWGGWLSIGSQ